MSDILAKRVIGLKYEQGEGLPQLILKGQGLLAQEILRRGMYESPIPVVKNDELLEKLFRLPIDAHITPELFKIVAIMLAHVFTIERQLQSKGEE